MIGDRDTMRVMSQVFQDVFRNVEGWSDIDPPSDGGMPSRRNAKNDLLSARCCSSPVRDSLPSRNARLSRSCELATEYIGKYTARKKEAIARLNPFSMVRR